jgi:hypothetical protein
VVYIEQGKQEAKLSTLERIARSLGVGLCDLIVPTSFLDGDVRRLLGLSGRPKRPHPGPGRAMS